MPPSNIGVVDLPECEAVSLVPPLLAPLFPERPLSRAFKLMLLLSALEALPSAAVASLGASPDPLLLAAFFTSLLVFFNLSWTSQSSPSRILLYSKLGTSRPCVPPLQVNPSRFQQRSDVLRGCQQQQLPAREELAGPAWSWAAWRSSRRRCTGSPCRSCQRGRAGSRLCGGGRTPAGTRSRSGAAWRASCPAGCTAQTACGSRPARTATCPPQQESLACRHLHSTATVMTCLAVYRLDG